MGFYFIGLIRALTKRSGMLLSVIFEKMVVFPEHESFSDTLLIEARDHMVIWLVSAWAITFQRRLKR